MLMNYLSTQGQVDSVTATTFLAEYHRALSGVMELRAFHDERTQSDGGGLAGLRPSRTSRARSNGRSG
jgi:hypothetical protein